MTRILIIEDDALIRENVADYLEHFGYEVAQAADGEEGVAQARENEPDLIVCDLAMPRMDGYQVLECLRQEPITAHLPFLFLTAFNDRQNMRQGMVLGADDYLTKPFDLEELREAIETRLRRLQIYQDNLEEAKRSISRMISHELRTPLSGIVMANEMLSRNLDTMSPRDLHEILAISRNGGRRLQRLTDQIALKTQIDAGFASAGELEVLGQPRRLWDLVGEAVKAARENAYRNAKLPVRAKVSEIGRIAEVKMVERNMRTALLELLINALVYSSKDGEVMIKCWVERGYMCLAIRDSGPGIPDDQLDEALAAFSQLNREKREQQGLGLGLFLAMKVIDAHNGFLSFDNRAEAGFTVRVALPLAQAAD